jgi:transketolase
VFIGTSECLSFAPRSSARVAARPRTARTSFASIPFVTLAINAIQQAKSGHPGTPMGLALVPTRCGRISCASIQMIRTWRNRDRFVRSNGHASMLLYALLHLSAVKAVDFKCVRLDEPAVTLDDIKQFRQIGSRCPGHPEYHLTSGVVMIRPRALATKVPL